MRRRLAFVVAWGAAAHLCATGSVNLTDLPKVDLGRAVATREVEALLGARLLGEGKCSSYDGTFASTGCQWDGGKLGGETVFACAAIVPASSMRLEVSVSRRGVSGLGGEAFLNNGADARQFWVLINDRQALLVARGNRSYDARLETFARTLVARLGS